MTRNTLIHYAIGSTAMFLAGYALSHVTSGGLAASALKHYGRVRTVWKLLG